MDIEELSKSQIVLLTLLVSFVTSIATGIVTVSLMGQAPPTVAETVNRVLEQTVEKVTPAGQPAAATITQQKTVIVNESDLISQAVTSASPSVVRIYSTDTGIAVFLGLGVVLDAQGTVAADSAALGESPDAMLTLSNGTSVRAFVRARDSQSGLSYLLAATSSSATMPTWTPATLLADHAVLGESVVALSGKTIPRIESGLIDALAPSGEASTSPQVIETDIDPGSILDGSPIIDTDGALVGISTGVSRAVDPSGFISAAAILPPASIEQ